MLCAPLIERLTSVTFSKLEEVTSYPIFTYFASISGLQCEAEEMLRQRKLGFSFVRLLPKDTGVRPIVNLRRKRAEIKVNNLTWSCEKDLTRCTPSQVAGENERSSAIHQRYSPGCIPNSHLREGESSECSLASVAYGGRPRGRNSSGRPCSDIMKFTHGSRPTTPV